MNANEFMEKSKKLNPLDYAKKMIVEHKIIYSKSGEYYKYNKGYYNSISENKILRFISDELGSCSNNFINQTFRYIRSESEVEPNKLNADKNIINLKNGLFHIDKQELFEHTPDNLSTIQLSFEYKKDSQCPKWEQALKEILITEDQIELFQEMFGLCFTREVYGRAAVLVGEGRNGKSTLLKVLKTMLGNENVCSVEPTQMDKAHNMARLHDKIANICSEITTKGVMADGPLKQIITGDPVEGCFKYESSFSFEPFCKILFATNTLPHVDDKSEAFYNRLIILHFDRRFSYTEAKHNFHCELLTEDSGIFNWAMAGFKRLEARKYFKLSSAMENTLNAYKKENNPIIAFIDENCILAKNASVECGALYEHYKKFCERDGYRAYSRNKFSREFGRLCKDRVYRDDKARPVVWEGINVSNIYSINTASILDADNEDGAEKSQNGAEEPQDTWDF